MCRPGNKDSCHATNNKYSSVTELWRSAVCSIENTAKWHKLSCLMRKCKDCPQPPFCPRGLSDAGDTLVRWKAYEYVTEETNKAGPKKRIKLLYKDNPPSVVIQQFNFHLNTFITHNFNNYWQHTQFKECIGSFPEDVVVSVVDSAKNYTFKIQNEIQSMHWYNDQCTILVQICYWKENGVPKK